MDTAHLRLMTIDDLEQVLAWRNHPEIRRYMYTQHEIASAEHAGWFDRARQQPGRHLLILEVDKVRQGFVNLYESKPGGIADWGFYIAPDAPKGTGQRLGRYLLQYAFGELGLHKLCGQALGFNTRSIQFHQRLGFTQEGVLRDQHHDGQQYHDVVYFGLLASEWRASLEK